MKKYMVLIAKILKFEFSNVFRSKWIIFIFTFFFLLSYALFSFEHNSQKSILSLFNVTIYLIPLIGLIFGTMYLYNSADYIEMILCQPIPRSSLYIGLYLGTALPLLSSFVFGILIPLILFGNFSEVISLILLLILIGIALTLISLAVAFYVSTKINDKVKGLSLSIFFWLVSAIVFDGLILIIAYVFQDYPIEKFLIALTIMNPIDLSRTLFVLNFDVSALMGYSGALFKKFYGSSLGSIVSVFSLIIWLFIPLILGLKSFNKKDF